jgi:hypothetical protein
MTLKAGQAFHVYPSQQQTFVRYDRGTPMACDMIEFDTTGCWDVSQYGWVAPADCVVQFYAEILWQTPPNGAYTCAVICLNPAVPPPPVGDPTGEVAGALDTVMNWAPGGQACNQGTMAMRVLKLKKDDVVKIMPCINSGGTLCNSVGQAGYSDCTFFEGVVLSVDC